MNKAGRPQGSKNTPKRILNLVLPENKDTSADRILGILKAEETLYNFRKTGAGAAKLPKQELKLNKKKERKPRQPRQPKQPKQPKEKQPKFKITSSQRKLLKSFNPEGLPDFRTRDFKNLSYEDKENYILEQLEIAKENRKDEKKRIEKEKIKDKLYYTEIDVSIVFPNYNQTYNTKEFNELLSVFYKLYKSYRGMNIIVRYVNQNEILMTLSLDIPINNFSRWWKNYSKFGYGIFEGSSEEFVYKDIFIDNDFNGYLYFYKQINEDLNKDQNEFIKQFFKEHKISNCLLEPIKYWAIDC